MLRKPDETRRVFLHHAPLAVWHALQEIGSDGGGAASAARALGEHLENTSADRVVAGGLHEYLEDFLVNIAAFNGALTREYFEHHLEEAG